MLVDIPYLWVALLNIVWVPLAHLAASWFATKLPSSLFQTNALTLPFIKGESRSFYESRLQIKRWKDKLPDAAQWFGGEQKAELKERSQDYLQRFILETRRGEFAHVLQIVLLCIPVLWTPWPWALIFPVYAVLSNITCIPIQRYNRLRFEKLLRGRNR